MRAQQEQNRRQPYQAGSQGISRQYCGHADPKCGNVPGIPTPPKVEGEAAQRVIQIAGILGVPIYLAQKNSSRSSMIRIGAATVSNLLIARMPRNTIDICSSQNSPKAINA